MYRPIYSTKGHTDKPECIGLTRLTVSNELESFPQQCQSNVDSMYPVIELALGPATWNLQTASPAQPALPCHAFDLDKEGNSWLGLTDAVTVPCSETVSAVQIIWPTGSFGLLFHVALRLVIIYISLGVFFMHTFGSQCRPRPVPLADPTINV